MEASSSSQNSTISVVGITKPLSVSVSSPDTERRNRVQFAPNVQVYSTIHHSEYSPEERSNTWINAADVEAMKQERKACLRIMEKTNPMVDDEQHYFRGLEGKTQEGFKRKRFNFVDACMTVLDEQSDQLDYGKPDPDAIARAYAATTVSCVETARQRGIFDAAAAVSSSPLSLSFFGF